MKKRFIIFVPDVCSERRLESACALTQSDQSFRCPNEKKTAPLATQSEVKLLIRMCEYAGGYESLLDAYVRRYVL